MRTTVALHLVRHGLQGLAPTLHTVHQVDLRGEVDVLHVSPHAVRAAPVHPEVEVAAPTEEVVVGLQAAILQELISSLSGCADSRS